MRCAHYPGRKSKITFTQPSLAKQSFKDECDINNILRQYQKTGLLEHVNEHQGQYGNFIGFQDYHTSMNQLIDADNMFMTIPSKLRAKFNNSALEFLTFAQDPKNGPEMVELGLATKKPDSPQKAKAGDQPPPKEKKAAPPKETATKSDS